MEKKQDEKTTPCGNNLERMALNGLMNVVSGNECTGIIPSRPIDFEEAEAYSDIYDIPVPESEGKETPSGNKKR